VQRWSRNKPARGFYQTNIMQNISVNFRKIKLNLENQRLTDRSVYIT